MNKYAIASIIIVLVIAGILGYYYINPLSGGGNKSTTPAQNTGSSTNTTSSGGATSKLMSIVDDLNRTVKLRVPVHRVVSTIRIVTSFLLQFNVKDLLVGVDSTMTDNPFYTSIDPWLRNVTIVATGKRNINLEEIIKLQPDVVFAKNYQRPLLQGIEDKVNIVYLDLETPESFMHDLLLVGKILGQEDRAISLKNYYENLLGMVENKTNSLPDNAKPKVLFIYYKGENSYNIPPTHWIQYYMVKLAGGRIYEVSGTGWMMISTEQIISYNPDIVFITAYHGLKPSIAAEKFMNNTLLSVVSAVRKHRVYPVPFDGEPWDMPTPKWILCTVYMATRIHPELFSNINMTELTIQFYIKVYGAPRQVAAQLVPSEVKGRS